MPASNKRLKIAAGVAGSFIGLVAIVIAVRIAKVISYELAMLMLVTLVGLYVGFGILIACYRFLNTLDDH